MKNISDEHFMKLAIKEAILAKENGEWPFGSIIVCKGKVIARNRRSETADQNVLSHAELKTVGDACKKLKRINLSDCTLYTTNEPCMMCAAAIFQAKIPRIVIALSRSDLSHLLRERKLHIEDLAKDSGFKVEIIKHVLKEEAMDLFKDVTKN